MSILRPAISLQNRLWAIELKIARKDILDVLCSDQGTLRVLMRAYSKKAGKRQSTTKTQYDDIAAQAARLFNTSYSLPDRPSQHALARMRALLIDRMLDLRLPDDVVLGIPQLAVDYKYCNDAQRDLVIQRLKEPAKRFSDARDALIFANLPAINRHMPPDKSFMLKVRPVSRSIDFGRPSANGISIGFPVFQSLLLCF